MTTRQTAAHCHPRIRDVFDGYVQGRITRRQFLDEAAKYAVGGLTAAAIPDSLKPDYAMARQADAADVPAIRAPLQLHDAELDERIDAAWPACEAALKEHGEADKAHVYPGVNHGFRNESAPRCDAAAAELAWSRTLAFFERHLRADA